jgi:hypothetical protein
VKILRDAEASSLRKCLAAMVVWGCTAVIHADRRRKVRDSLKIPLETKSRFGVLRRSATPSLCPVGTLYPVGCPHCSVRLVTPVGGGASLAARGVRDRAAASACHQ